MKLPITMLKGTVPPQFEYYQTINLLEGGTQVIKHVGPVPVAMEAALITLIGIAEQQAKELAQLKAGRK